MVLARLFSNSTPPSLQRAITAYRQLAPGVLQELRQPGRRIHRARRLNESQLVRLVEGYRDGDTVYQLAERFSLDRRTVSVRLKDQGISLRRQPPTTAMIDEMVRLYATGLSATKIGALIGVSADTVLNYLRLRGVVRRGPHRPHKAVV